MTCADLETFVRGSPTLTTFCLVDKRREDPKSTKRVSSAARKLGSFVIFQGIWTSVAKKPHFFFYFSSGTDPFADIFTQLS